MSRGLSRDRIGITPQMQASFGDLVFNLSHNHQVRRGDPVREKDFAAIEEQRAALGLSDGEIAERVGLTIAQVTYIRTLEERRRFRTGHYYRLNELGGGRRYREERMSPALDHFRYAPAALAVRAVLRFDGERARDYVSAGRWTAATPLGWLRRWADRRADSPALVAGESQISYGELAAAVDQIAAGLLAEGVRPGDPVLLVRPAGPAGAMAMLALARLGAPALALDERLDAEDREEAALAAGCRLAVEGDPEGLGLSTRRLDDEPIGDGADWSLDIVPAPVASDPLILWPRRDGHGDIRLAVHNGHTALAGLAAVAALQPEAPAIACPASWDDWRVWFAAMLALRSGASLVFGDAPADALAFDAASLPDSDAEAVAAAGLSALSLGSHQVIGASSAPGLLARPRDDASWQALAGAETQELDDGEVGFSGPQLSPGHLGGAPSASGELWRSGLFGSIGADGRVSLRPPDD